MRSSQTFGVGTRAGIKHPPRLCLPRQRRHFHQHGSDLWKHISRCDPCVTYPTAAVVAPLAVFVLYEGDNTAEDPFLIHACGHSSGRCKPEQRLSLLASLRVVEVLGRKAKLDRALPGAHVTSSEHDQPPSIGPRAEHRNLPCTCPVAPRCFLFGNQSRGEKWAGSVSRAC